MKNSPKKVVIGVSSIVILVLALVFAIVNGIQPVDVWGHAQPIGFGWHVLDFLLVLCIGFGVLCAVLGFSGKSAWYVFLSTGLLTLGLLYLLLYLVFWWIAIIILFVFVAVMCILYVTICGSKTEFAVNKDPDYKNYEQRKAEKDALEASKPEEELPEIKSFK